MTSDHVYKPVELTGSSSQSIEHATGIALKRVSKTLEHLRWLEVVNVRGMIENGEVGYYQVSIKLGFTLDD